MELLHSKLHINRRLRRGNKFGNNFLALCGMFTFRFMKLRSCSSVPGRSWRVVARPLPRQEWRVAGPYAPIPSH